MQIGEAEWEKPSLSFFVALSLPGCGSFSDKCIYVSALLQ